MKGEFNEGRWSAKWIASEISSVREFKDARAQGQDRGKILLLVRDEGVDRYVVLQQDKQDKKE